MTAVTNYPQTARVLGRRYAIYIILLLAFAVQFYGLNARTLHGDEFNSINEAAQLGLNPNGLLYFVILHGWQLLGMSEFWLRVPSACCNIAAVAVNYSLARALFNQRVGLLVGLLLALSPFVIEYGQQVRFYALFLFTASLAWLAFVTFLRRPSRRMLLYLVLANLLLLGSHFFGLLVMGSEVLTAFALTKHLSLRSKLVLAGVILILLTFALSSMAVRTFAFELVSRLTNPYGTPVYAGARGLGLTNFAKVPLTFFFFSLGESVHPLDYLIVVPAAVLITICSAHGMRAMWRQGTIGRMLLLSLILLPILLYVVFDPLAAGNLQGAAPRYLIFLVPSFCLLLAAGIAYSRMWLLLFGLLLSVNLVALGAYWNGAWSYSDDKIDWRAVTQWVAPQVNAQTVIVVDGRAQPYADYYFPSAWQTRRDGSALLEQNAAYQNNSCCARVISISYDFHDDRRSNADDLQGNLERGYTETAVWAQYPLFVNVYDRKSNDADTFTVDSNGSVQLPTEIYGLEFQDLRLPFDLSFDGRTIKSYGSFLLNGHATRTIGLATPTLAHRIFLFSDMTNARSLTPGTAVARVVLQDPSGRAQDFELRAGYETAAWNGLCVTSACSVAYSWHKRLALLGSESYPESYTDFNASVFATELTLPHPTTIQAIQLQRVPSSGDLYIWGIALKP